MRRGDLLGDVEPEARAARIAVAAAKWIEDRGYDVHLDGPRRMERTKLLDDALDDRDEIRARPVQRNAAAHELRELEAVDLQHLHVDEREGGLVDEQQIERPGRRSSFDDVCARALEQSRQRQQIVVEIVDEQTDRCELMMTPCAVVTDRDAKFEKRGAAVSDNRFIGTAGWSIPKRVAPYFPTEGTHLERYSRVLTCTEINTSFYRPHARATYEKWARQTPAGFRFSAKIPRGVTHEQRLRSARPVLETFMAQVGGLGPKLGAILVQLPPSLRFELDIAHDFFTVLRDLYSDAVVCEPRHSTWFNAQATALLASHRVARVIADPPIVDAALARVPRSASPLIEYWRLHGSPRMYWSRYSREAIQRVADRVSALPASASAWCVFDNTAAGAAIENALEMAGPKVDD